MFRLDEALAIQHRLAAPYGHALAAAEGGTAARALWQEAMPLLDSIGNRALLAEYAERLAGLASRSKALPGSRKRNQHVTAFIDAIVR